MKKQTTHEELKGLRTHIQFAETRKLARFVGCCTLCTWIGGQSLGAVAAGYQALDHAKETHPEEFGMVGYIMRIEVSEPKSSMIPMRRGRAKVTNLDGGKLRGQVMSD